MEQYLQGPDYMKTWNMLHASDANIRTSTACDCVGCVAAAVFLFVKKKIKESNVQNPMGKR